jgi:CheY-like chemotaxis protein
MTAVLVVDDEPAVLRLIDLYLTRNGYVVTASACGEDACVLFEESPDTFRLAIVDLTLPTMTGVELIKKLRELRRDFPVVVTSGYPIELSAFAGGPTEALQKPFLPNALLDAVGRMASLDGNNAPTL